MKLITLPFKIVLALAFVIAFSILMALGTIGASHDT